MKLSWKVFVGMVFGALWCGLAHPAAAVTQNFESMTNNTPLNSVPGWQAPADHVIRQTSLIASNFAGYGSVGYTNNHGVECYIENSAFPSNSCQRGALWTLTGGDVLTQNGGVFQFDVRLTSWSYDGTNVDNTNMGFKNGFWVLLGTGMQYESNNSRVVWTNASAFGICFVDNEQGDHIIDWDEVAGAWGSDDINNGAPGWGTRLSGGVTSNWNRRIVMPWVRDVYYTIQLSNIVFSTIQATQATAVLSIFETANPANVITNNIFVRANGGNQPLQTAPFTNINQIAFAVARLGGLDHYDNVILAQPPSGVSTTVLQITSIVRQGNDINLTWMTGTAGGQTNAVQVTSGDTNGNYATNNFADIASLVIPSPGIVVTNHVDVGAATNKPSRYYRVRLVP